MPSTVTLSYSEDTYVLNVSMSESPVVVEVREAAAGPPGTAGANAEIVVLSLAAYLALAPEVQMDGRWYVIPKT